jgi:DNA polymerase III subunit alpha
VGKLPELPAHDLLAHEKELLGFYVTGHPLLPYASLLERYSLHNTASLAGLVNRAMTRIGGLVAAVQSGFSKKTGKAYALVTLEDLEGSVQILFVNENYEKFKPLLVPNKAVLVLAEVNVSEDKPKLFPQEILPLEDAPKRYTKQVHLRLPMETLTESTLEKAHGLATAFKGRVPLFLCLRWASGQSVFIEAHERFGVSPGLELQEAVTEAFGEDAYYVAVDTAPPERAPRRWERREGNGTDEG